MVLCTDCMLAFPCSHSAELCQQLFLCSDFLEKLIPSIPEKKGRGSSQVLLHMSSDDWGSVEGLPPCLLLNREVISLMKSTGCRVYSGTDKHVEYFITKTRGNFCCSFANRSSRTFTVVFQTDIRTGRASASQQLVLPVLQ